MPKYSTNSKNDSDDTEGKEVTGVSNCELCGTESDNLRKAKVAQAMLVVCPSCSPLDDAAKDKSNGTRDEDETDRTKQVIQKAVQNAPPQDDSWVDETQYDNNQMPYLVDGYSEMIQEAREKQDLNQAQLADKAGVGVKALRLIESGQALRTDAGKDEIKRLEVVLEINLIEEV